MNGMRKIITVILLTISVVNFCGAQEDEPQPQQPTPVRQTLSPAEQRKFDYFFYEGLRLKNADKADDAFEMFRHCLAIDSTSSAAYFELSSFYIQLNRPEEAVALIKKSVLYSPDNQEYHNMLATLLFNIGMYGEAAEEYENLIKAFPEKNELNLYLAESYTRMGELGKAIEIYDALENSTDIMEPLTMEKYQLYMTLKQPEEAMAELQKLSDKYPVEPRYKIVIGDMYLQQGEYAQALQYYEMARAIDPETPYYPVSMANYYEKTGQSDSAKMQIQEALTNPHLDVNTKLTILARFIMQLKRSKQDIEGADTLFHTLIEQHPEDSRLKLAYSEFLATQQKFDDAFFYCGIVTVTEPENLDAWLLMLRLSLQQQNTDDIISICLKCQEIFPESMEFYFYLGMAYAQKNDYALAIETYKKAIPLISDENQVLVSDFYGQLGDTYFRLRQTDNAFEAYEEALKHNDKNIVVLNNYAYYLSLMKQDLTKAERMSAQCIKMEPENATYIDTYAWIFFMQGNYSLAKIYIEQALAKERGKNNPELIDHYGDILFLSGEQDKAVEQWRKAKEAGKKSATLDRKIADAKYYEESEDEIFNDNEPEVKDES